MLVLELSTSGVLARFTINDSDIFGTKIRGLENTCAVAVLLVLHLGSVYSSRD